MLFEYALHTPRKDFINITPQLREAAAKSGVSTGIAVIYCPHTTAGITINENADPDVVHDLLLSLREAFPDRPQFRHSEGNSAAHLKAAAGPCWARGRACTSASSTGRASAHFM